jgi:hypothetical protein
MSTAQLVKWDAAVVGDHPPIGRWVNRNNKTLKLTPKQPHKIVRGLASLIGRKWVIGVDAATIPGCLEIINIEPGKAPEIVFQRKQ